MNGTPFRPYPLLALALLASACASPSETQAQVKPQVQQQSQFSESPRERVGASPGDRRGFVVEYIFFDFDSAVLRPDAVDAIHRLVEKYEDRYPDLNFVIEGHADARGTEGYNLDLGCRRAAAVRDALMERGIPAERTLSVSFGETRPHTLGDKEAAWSRYRRVVIGPTTGDLREYRATLAPVPNGKIRYCMAH